MHSYLEACLCPPLMKIFISLICLCTLVASIMNIMDSDQTAPLGHCRLPMRGQTIIVMNGQERVKMCPYLSLFRDFPRLDVGPNIGPFSI